MPSPRRPGDCLLERLTSRQRETLQLIAEGHSAKEIAQKLNISVRTAELHRARLMEALDIHDIAGLVRYAIRMGLIARGVDVTCAFRKASCAFRSSILS